MWGSVLYHGYSKRAIMTDGTPIAVDLFSGCGGMSAGLRDAGFNVIAGVDKAPAAIATFQGNFPDAKAISADLSAYTPGELMAELGINPGELDVLAGGPPCQGFSKNVPRNRRAADSLDNRLMSRFLDYCVELRPKAIMLENVAEMSNGFEGRYTEQISTRLADAGYVISHSVINAAEFGVPQLRRRAFVLGNRSDNRLVPPPPTHKPSDQQGSFFGVRSYVSVWDAIGDLPSLQHGEGKHVSHYTNPPLSDYQRMARGWAHTVINHIARRLKPLQYERMAALEPGQGLNDLPDELKVRSGYSGAYGRLTQEMVAPTITRWVFHPGSGRWGHPVDVRTLTMREAARLQGFKDDFAFTGSIIQQAAQIGNAVPPLLAAVLGKAIRRQLAI